MSPQPTAPAKPAEEAKPTEEAAKQDEQTAEVKYLNSIHAKPEAERTAEEKQILRAAHLERDRGDLMERIGKNRDYLRLMADNEVLTPEQVTWVNTFYPEKEKGERRNASDIEATRKAREGARKLH